MKGIIFMPIIAFILLAIGGLGLIWMFNAILNVLSIVVLVIATPFIIKLIADLLFYNLGGVDKKISIVMGVILAIPIILVLYQNMTALLFGSMVIFGIYLIGFPALKNTTLGSALSIKQWFGKRRKR